MGYFDFVMSEVHGLRIKELLDENSKLSGAIATYEVCRNRHRLALN